MSETGAGAENIKKLEAGSSGSVMPPNNVPDSAGMASNTLGKGGRAINRYANTLFEMLGLSDMVIPPNEPTILGANGMALPEKIPSNSESTAKKIDEILGGRNAIKANTKFGNVDIRRGRDGVITLIVKGNPAVTEFKYYGPNLPVNAQSHIPAHEKSNGKGLPANVIPAESVPNVLDLDSVVDALYIPPNKVVSGVSTGSGKKKGGSTKVPMGDRSSGASE